MQEPLRYRHRSIIDDDLVFIRKLIAEHPGSSRWELSRKVCQVWNGVRANGAMRHMVCRSMMPMLHRRSLVELPVVRRVQRNWLVERKQIASVEVQQTALQTSFAELGAIELHPVRRTPKAALFNSLLHQHHYPGYAQPVGEHLNHLVYAKGRPVACVAWSSAPLHLGSRDRLIGWSRQERLANIALLACNTRFRIRPWVMVPHLASHILGHLARLLSAD